MSLDESYRALGLKPGATLNETKQAYYRLLKFFHPDRHQSSPGLVRKATEETKKLNLAYERIRKVLTPSHRSRPAAPRQNTSRSSPLGDPPVQGRPFVIPSCGIKLNWVAAGRFQMGSPPTEAGRSNDEGPQTNVTISRGFWLGVFIVTQEEWKTVAENTTGLKAEPSFFRESHRLPVEQVSWSDCQYWLQELNTIEETANRLPRDWHYQLPTEAEWEFACRAGSLSRFHFGDADTALGDHGWYSANSAGQTHPVGEKIANPWGFYDMHGNVWEWCQDRYGPLPGGSVTDPQGPVFGLKRLLRGGSWGVAASRCRSAYRVWNDPDYRDYTLGFRIALVPSK